MIEAAVAALARRLLLARMAERGDVDVVGVQSPVVVVGIPSLQNKVANARDYAPSAVPSPFGAPNLLEQPAIGGSGG